MIFVKLCLSLIVIAAGMMCARLFLTHIKEREYWIAAYFAAIFPSIIVVMGLVWVMP